MPLMHFLVEPEALRGEMADRVVLRACRPRGTVGLLVASPVVARHGYLIEQVARLPDAPNGASEWMIDGAMRHFAEQGRHYVTLGLVAISRNATTGMKENPLWLRTLMLLARTHVNRFYNFEGLEWFRTKMKPDMRSHCSQGRYYAISVAISVTPHPGTGPLPRRIELDHGCWPAPSVVSRTPFCVATPIIINSNPCVPEARNVCGSPRSMGTASPLRMGAVSPATVA